MGLDTSHGCFHGAYSAFSRFRNELAKAAGYEVDHNQNVVLDWSRFEDKNYQGEWDTPPDDPLIILIAHSDCDGVIPPAYCGHLAARIDQLIPSLREDGEGHLALLGVRGAAKRFADGLREAAEANEPVEFF